MVKMGRIVTPCDTPCDADSKPVNIALLTLIQTSSRGVADPYILNEDTHTRQCTRSEYDTQHARMSSDEWFDLTAAVYFNFV